MLGIPAVDVAAAAASYGKPAPSPGSPASQPKVAKKGTPARTMLGLPAVAQPQAPTAAPGAAKPARPAPKKRPMGATMIGMTAPAPSPAPNAPRRQRAAEVFIDPAAEGDPFADSMSDVTVPTSKAPLYVIGAVVGLAILAGLGVGLYALLSSGPEVSVAVVHTETGDALQVDVAGNVDGSRVRFGGQEEPLEAGRATLPLAAEALQVGSNPVVLTIIDPEGDAETVELTLTLGYRVRADLSTLAANPPVLRYQVTAAPGAQVLLDQQPVTLDDRGHGVRDYPINAETANETEVLERVVHYQVTLPGQPPEIGNVRTRVPYTTLTVDRPGARLVTDRDSVELAGAIAESATITVNDAPIENRSGRYLHRFALPTMGENEIRLVSTQPGTAPRQRLVRVLRVADLAAEAARYPVDRSLTYARVAQNPTIYRGRAIELTGRVFHVNVADGRSVIQMLVRGCGGGQRCSAWVTYPAATDAAVGQWVRVIGDVAGTQTYRPRGGGDPISVARIDAHFVLRAGR